MGDVTQDLKQAILEELYESVDLMNNALLAGNHAAYMHEIGRQVALRQEFELMLSEEEEK